VENQEENKEEVVVASKPTITKSNEEVVEEKPTEVVEEKPKQTLMEVQIPSPTYDLCLVSSTFETKDIEIAGKGEIIIIEILRKEVKISDEKASSDNKLFNQREKGLGKLWINSKGNVEVGEKISYKEKGDKISNFYINLV